MDNEGFKRWMKREAFVRIIFAIPKKPKWQAAEEAGSTGTKEWLYSRASRLSNHVKVLAWLAHLASSRGSWVHGEKAISVRESVKVAK